MTAAVISQVRDQVAESARAFLRWWLGELWAIMPPGARRRLPQRSRPAIWDLSRDAPRIWRKGEGWRDAPAAEGTGKAGPKALASADVTVDPALVFRKEITLPKMPASQARAALGLQLNRHAPFRAEDMVFDCRLTGENAGAGTVTAELALMRCADLTTLSKRLAAYGLGPRRIGLLMEGPEPDVLFNFHERTSASRPTRMHGLLAMMAAALALATLFAVEDRRAAELTAWRAAAAEQARAAAQVKQLREKVNALGERTAFLKSQWQAVPRVDLLETLSTALPDGTWLESVDITGSKIRLTGYSNKASSVPEWLQKTGKVRDLRFVSAVSSTAKPGVDRFDVEGMAP